MFTSLLSLRSARPARGFTLVELLVVIAIAGVLLALLFPAIQAARAAARVATCQSRLRQIGLALHNFESSAGRLPAGNDFEFDRDLRHSWCTRILPFLDQAPLAARYDEDRPWNAATGPGGDSNADVTATNLAVFLCPAEPFHRPGGTDYAGNAGSTLTGLPYGYNQGEGWVAGALIAINCPSLETVREPVRLAEVTDGLSQTLLVYECTGRKSNGGRWGSGTNCLAVEEPVNASLAADSIVSRHSSGGHALFADGRVVFLSNSTDLTTLGALATRYGGEPVIGSF